MLFYPRFIKKQIIEGLKTMPCLFLNGPRQAGKSTLAEAIIRQMKAGSISFDDLSAFSAATENPEGFIEHLNTPILLDEIQRVPSLFLALKKRIDQHRLTGKGTKENGQFLLTGSANVLALPNLADALVGRMGISTLYPLSSEEVVGEKHKFLYKLWNKTQFQLQPNHFSISQMIEMATFPQLASDKKINRNRWCQSYLTTLLQRDIKDLAEIEKVSALPNMLQIMASRVGGLINEAAFAREAGMNAMTFTRYRHLFKALFLTTDVLAWHKNIGKRLVKASKLYFIDTVLLCYLLGVDIKTLQKNNANLYGKVVENFVFSELLKQLTQEEDGSLYHFRTQDGKEVDFVIEKRNGNLLGLEVKARETITAHDFSQLKQLQSLTGAQFKKGIVLYGGEKILSFGKNLYAMPISTLWRVK